MPKVNPQDAIQSARQKSDTRVKSTDGHPILPTWMSESPKENVLPYNPLHTYLQNGREQDGHRVNDRDLEYSYPDD